MILLICLLVFGILSGLLVSKYSAYCEVKYEMNEVNPSSVKRTIIITLISFFLMLFDYLMFKDDLVASIIIAGFSAVMLYMIVIDFETMYILDRTHIVIGILAVLGMIFMQTELTESLASIKDGLIGGLVGGGLFFLVALIANPMAQRKYGEDVQALGYGDVKLMAVCGLFVGWKLILLSIILGSLVGVILQVIIKAVSKKEEVNFAFGPYLAIGILLSLYFGNSIIELYLNIIGA